ncbi:MAG TPA: phage tail terminator-like protein [Polyangiales bacterium]|nr:phage tail terminator-like protein [Polyangiales bacterium]
MSYAAIHDAIRTRFKNLVADAESVPVAYPNAPFETPDDQSMWVRLSILDGQSSQIELEANDGSTYRRVGNLIAQIFAPAQQSTGDAMDLADVIAAAFRRVYAIPVRYRVPSVQTIGRSNGWWQVNVVCPWESELIS